MSWNGIRVTLGCGHMDLRDLPDGEQKRRWVIGGIAICRVCPCQEGTGGVSVTRQIVNIEPVTVPRPPVSRVRLPRGEDS